MALWPPLCRLVSLLRLGFVAGATVVFLDSPLTSLVGDTGVCPFPLRRCAGSAESRQPGGLRVASRRPRSLVLTLLDCLRPVICCLGFLLVCGWEVRFVPSSAIAGAVVCVSFDSGLVKLKPCISCLLHCSVFHISAPLKSLRPPPVAGLCPPEPVQVEHFGGAHGTGPPSFLPHDSSRRTLPSRVLPTERLTVQRFRSSVIIRDQ